MHRSLIVAIALFASACTFDDSNTAADPGLGQADASTIDARIQPSVDASLFDASESNQTPTITTVANQVTHNTLVGPVSFTVDDADDEVSTLTVTATSSDQTVVADADIAVGGTGANRSVALMPTLNVAGSATITLQVTDGNSFAVRPGSSVDDLFVDSATIGRLRDTRVAMICG